MQIDQIVTVTFFRFSGLSNRWWAFRQMGLSPESLKAIPGLTFAKMLGSGAGNGFSIRPNFGVYGLLGVWENEALADQFFDSHPLFRECRERSEDLWTAYLHTAKVNGQWDNQMPFLVSTPYDPEKPVGVLTRATIYPRHLWRFWRFVPPVSRSMSRHQEGLVFSIGIGELPLIQQATFSLWQNSRYMQAYAYQSPHHSKVVKRTREIGWYSEELFARFHPYRFEGNWPGVDTAALR